MSSYMDYQWGGLNGVITTSTGASGITVYYQFNNFGYLNYSATSVPNLFMFVAVQSAHPAGGSYWTPWSYWISAKHQYSSGWKAQWHEERLGPHTAQALNGKYRTGSSYYDELAESYANDTYYMAVQLSSGGSGTAITGWNGYAIRYDTNV